MPLDHVMELALLSRRGDEAQILQTRELSAGRGFIGDLLERQLVDETTFLRELAARFQLPWWDAPIPPNPSLVPAASSPAPDVGKGRLPKDAPVVPAPSPLP